MQRESQWANPLLCRLRTPGSRCSLSSQALKITAGLRSFCDDTLAVRCGMCSLLAAQYPGTSLTQWGHPPLQRLLQGYAALTEPEDGPASGSISVQLNCAKSLSRLSRTRQWEHSLCASFNTLNIGTVSLSSVITRPPICHSWPPSRTLQIHKCSTCLLFHSLVSGGVLARPDCDTSLSVPYAWRIPNICVQQCHPRCC